MGKRKDCSKKLLTKINNVKKNKLKLKEYITNTKKRKKRK